MESVFVPPTDQTTRETIITNTKPNSLTRKIRLALFELGVGRGVKGFPYVLWLSNKLKRDKE